MQHNNPIFEAALKYAARGWYVVPLDGKAPQGAVPGGWHGASIDQDQIEQWWKKWPDANVGVALQPSGLLVVDVDVKNGGHGREQLAGLVAEYGALPDTIEWTTGTGGRNMLFALPPEVELSSFHAASNVEVLRNYQAVMPPSIHPDSGEAYRWNDGRSLDDRDPTDADMEWVETTRSASQNGNASVEASRSTSDDWEVPEGERHEKFVSVAGTLRHRLALTASEIEAVLHVISPRFGYADNRDEHIRQVARSIEQYAPGQVPWKVRFGHDGDAGASASAKSRLVTQRYDHIERRSARWLWKDRVPRGSLTMLVGDPGLGKSQFTCWLAQHTTKDGGVVLMASAEDAPSFTIRPRLEVAGADLSLVHHVALADEHNTESAILLPDDLPALRQRIEEIGGIDLLVVDPVMAHLGAKVDSYRDKDVRSALAPLHQLADDFECAVVAVAHMNKGSNTNAVYRLGGSIGFAAAARSVLLLTRDPDDEDGERGSGRILANAKNNLAREAPSIRCQVEEVLLPPEVKDGVLRQSLMTTSRIVIGEECSIPASALLAATGGENGGGEQTAVDEAVAFLYALLADGPVRADEVKTEARRNGISGATLRRAKSKGGIVARQITGTAHGGWVWALPDDSDDHLHDHLTSDAQDDHVTETRTDAGGFGRASEAREPSHVQARADDHLLHATATDDGSAKDSPSGSNAPSSTEHDGGGHDG